jgi:hypothetical protein
LTFSAVMTTQRVGPRRCRTSARDAPSEADQVAARGLARPVHRRLVDALAHQPAVGLEVGRKLITADLGSELHHGDRDDQRAEGAQDQQLPDDDRDVEVADRMREPVEELQVQSQHDAPHQRHAALVEVEAAEQVQRPLGVGEPRERLPGVEPLQLRARGRA